MAGSGETVGDVLREIVPAGHRCGPVHATDDQMTRLLTAIDAKNAEQAARMPDTKAALAQLHDAFDRLKKLGWSEAMYCPKDGSTFEAIEAGSTGIFSCHYEGEWPKGSWWLADGGDLWPSRPILWRPTGQKDGEHRRLLPANPTEAMPGAVRTPLTPAVRPTNI